ncbi:hypothetical protein DFQ26_006053 [Actinomortierella ambigua]|nr:hypothetical protein DFQ26_006053 [Actinomortierella ambigua]
MSLSSRMRLLEFYAACKAIKDTSTWNMHVQLYCDNLSVCHSLEALHLPHPERNPRAQELMKKLRPFIRRNGIHLSVSHIPSHLNPADPISRHPITDTQRDLAKSKVLAFMLEH